jgi:hypothetical protein
MMGDHHFRGGAFLQPPPEEILNRWGTLNGKDYKKKDYGLLPPTPRLRRDESVAKAPSQ